MPEFEYALGVGDGQGSLGCCNPCGCKESDTTEQLNWTDTSLQFSTSLFIFNYYFYSVVSGWVFFVVWKMFY